MSAFACLAKSSQLLARFIFYIMMHGVHVMKQIWGSTLRLITSLPFETIAYEISSNSRRVWGFTRRR